MARQSNNKIFKITIISLAIIVGLFVISSSVMHITAAIHLSKDIKTQSQRLANGFSEEIETINEQDYAMFDLSLNPQINEVQTLSTHNSYKKKMPSYYYSISRFVGDLINRGGSYQYAHNTIINQLNNGIRGLELDIRYQKDEFYIFHSALFDQRTHNPKWTDTLKELLAWSNKNPEHTMINVLIEVKVDELYLNPYRKKLTDERLLKFNKSVIDILGEDRVLTPSDWKKDNESLNEMVLGNDWLTYEETKGKFVFLLHPHFSYTRQYINLDPTMDTLNIVPAIDSNYVEEFQDYAAFILDNWPDDYTKSLVDNNYFVRTRMDTDAIMQPLRREKAVWSGAQIISTDFAKDRIFPDNDVIANFGEDDYYTIRLNHLQ